MNGRHTCNPYKPITATQLSLTFVSRNGELRMQNFKSHLVRTQSLNVLPLNPRVGQYIAIHATLAAWDFFLAYYYLPVHSPALFPNPLKIFAVLAVANIWFLCRPAE